MKTKILRIIEDDAPYGDDPLEMFALIVSEKNINLNRIKKAAKECYQKMLDMNDDLDNEYDMYDISWDERVEDMLKYIEDKVDGIKIITDIEDCSIYCN